MASSSIDFVLLIPCFNNQSGLIKSLKSVQYPQEKFEVLVVDDGSDLPIEEVNLKQQFQNIKIQIIRLGKNSGVLNALNTGLNFLKSRSNIKYIARLDAGDICATERFYKQVDFLDKNKDIMLLSSWARFENIDTGKGYDYITKTTHSGILKQMHYKCVFIHPAVMFRTEILNTVGMYPDRFPHAEDYAFFWQIIKKHKGAVLPEKLVQISFSDKSVSSKNYKAQLRSRKKIVRIFGEQIFHKIMGLALLTIRQILPQMWIEGLKNRNS